MIMLLSMVYASSISLDSSGVAQIGGTGHVNVIGPGTVDNVKWVLTTSPPFKVTGVEITWTPASSTSSYVVYVTIYDDNQQILASGSANQAGSDTSVTTSISLDTSVDPENVYYVEIVIVET